MLSTYVYIYVYVYLYIYTHILWEISKQCIISSDNWQLTLGIEIESKVSLIKFLETLAGVEMYHFRQTNA
jgi:hypothetical protein